MCPDWLYIYFVLTHDICIIVVPQYLGEWYDVESYPSTFQYGTCNTARYSASGNNILVNNTQIIDGEVSVREAVGVFPEGNTVGKLRVNFGSNDRDYWILATDYSSYALVYSCINLDGNRKQGNFN